MNEIALNLNDEIEYNSYIKNPENKVRKTMDNGNVRIPYNEDSIKDYPMASSTLEQLLEDIKHSDKILLKESFRNYLIQLDEEKTNTESKTYFKYFALFCGSFLLCVGIPILIYFLWI